MLEENLHIILDMRVFFLKFQRFLNNSCVKDITQSFITYLYNFFLIKISYWNFLVYINNSRHLVVTLTLWPWNSGRTDHGRFLYINATWRDDLACESVEKYLENHITIWPKPRKWNWVVETGSHASPTSQVIVIEDIGVQILFNWKSR